jgi:hypothetical protein
MIDVLEDSGDRLVLKLDPGGPVELTGLTGSFGALARMYGRHYRIDTDIEPSPRLYVTRMDSGSVIAEIAPYAVIMGALVTTMGGANTIADFARRLSAGIRTFSDPTRIKTASADAEPLPSKDDAADIRAFVRPLTGKAGATLNITHARLETRTGDKHTIVEYSFDEAELNRAAVNIDQALSSGGDFLALVGESEPHEEVTTEAILQDVMLFFEQASRKPGRERGRTGDRGIIPDVSSKPLPVYFRKSFQNLKDQMIRGEANPLTSNAFIVDVYVHRDEENEPKAYYVTNVHRIVALGTDGN